MAGSGLPRLSVSPLSFHTPGSNPAPRSSATSSHPSSVVGTRTPKRRRSEGSLGSLASTFGAAADVSTPRPRSDGAGGVDFDFDLGPGLDGNSSSHLASLPPPPLKKARPTTQMSGGSSKSQESAGLQAGLEPASEAAIGSSHDGLVAVGSRPWWWESVPGPTAEAAVTSCQTGHQLNDDAINASLEMATSMRSELFTFNTLKLEIALDPDTGAPRLAGEALAAGQHIVPPTELRQACMWPQGQGPVFMLVFLLSGNHWVYARVTAPAKDILVVDSLPSPEHARQAELVLRAFVEGLLGTHVTTNFGSSGDGGEDGGGGGWAQWHVTHQTWLRQVNAVDCGVYALATAFLHAAGIDPLPQSISITLWRLFLASVLQQRQQQCQLSSLVPVLDASLPPLPPPQGLDLFANGLPTDASSTMALVGFAVRAHAHALKVLGDRSDTVKALVPLVQELIDLLSRLMGGHPAQNNNANAHALDGGDFDGDGDTTAASQALLPLALPSLSHLLDPLRVHEACLAGDIEARDHIISQLGRLQYSTEASGSTAALMQCELSGLRRLRRGVQRRIDSVRSAGDILSKALQELLSVSTSLSHQVQEYDKLLNQCKDGPSLITQS